MLITVAICTWNRAQLLRATLERFMELLTPAGCTWELIIVNNNSTDDTCDVLRAYADMLPLRAIYEKRQGQCHARNAAILAARGELLVWTDDDVLVAPDWLCKYIDAYRDWPEMDFYGGTIDPWFETPPPNWVLDNLVDMRAPLVLNQLGSETRPLAGSEYPMGANMALKTAVQREYLYDVTIGHNGRELVGGDDIDLVDRLRRENRKGLWVGNAKVEHFIPSARMSLEYLDRLAVGSGTLIARQNLNAPAPRLLRMPRWCLRRLLESTCAWASHRLIRRRRWVRAYMDYRRWWSFAKEWRRLTKAAPSTLSIQTQRTSP